jgi:hypothetical protein
MTSSEVPFNAKALDDLSQGDLIIRRQFLMDKCNNRAQALEDTDLEELVAIIGQLRRRSSGPPSSKQKAAAKPLADLDSLL